MNNTKPSLNLSDVEKATKAVFPAVIQLACLLGYALGAWVGASYWGPLGAAVMSIFFGVLISMTLSLANTIALVRSGRINTIR